MNRLSFSIVSLAALGLFCATLTYWVIKLATPLPVPVGAASVQAPVSLSAAAGLFGDDRAQDSRLRLSGILSLGGGRGAAAIISVDNGPSQAIAVGNHVGSDITLSEVRANSVIVDRNGARSEVTLPAPVAGPGAAGGTIYMH
ncbi:general secretion pathway protein GspC [Robbsia sp. Bb-Pol-6]|uniref:General secretion pathway protein GspC n=1 Tax=Robbsia betulipollinis TaxID=2981849 RepID=A0ABT3ZRK0_9BURK|nr:type II secretion system protein N [Robbsia betulipollinis]MCY0389184.1 general secretion pathway protein GspC [Robbsia betulipollinis]